jgi:hypothetical protein
MNRPAPEEPDEDKPETSPPPPQTLAGKKRTLTELQQEADENDENDEDDDDQDNEDNDESTRRQREGSEDDEEDEEDEDEVSSNILQVKCNHLISSMTFYRTMMTRRDQTNVERRR